MELTTSPAALDAGSRILGVEERRHAGLPAGVACALRMVAAGAGDPGLEVAALRLADRWGVELADLEAGGLAGSMRAAASAYGDAEAAVVTAVAPL